jgi:DNA-binding transcriptional regulator LsrR (DeoR family)
MSKPGPRSWPISDREVMRLVAELYYDRDLRQPEVAAMTGFSVSKVSRLLSAAREQGIVHITVEPAPEERPAVAVELGERFGTKVEITPGRQRDAAAAARLCGLGAVDRLLPRLPERGAIGVAAGYTMDAVASGMPRLQRPGLTIVPIVGGWDTENQFLDGNQLAGRLAQRIGAQSRTLLAPAVVETAAMREALLRDSTVAATATLWPHLDLALVGVGGAPTAHPGYRTVIDRLGEDTRGELRAAGVIGDLAGHFFRADGSFLEEWSERMLAISIAELRATTTIAIAAGPAKPAPIAGALRTGVLDVLVTDLATAQAVLALADRAA